MKVSLPTIKFDSLTLGAEAATISLAAMTAAVSLYANDQFLFHTAGGSFAVKLARNGNIHPLLRSQVKGAGYAETLLDYTKGDTVVNHCSGIGTTVGAIKNRLEKTGHPTAHRAVNAVIIPQNAEVDKDLKAKKASACKYRFRIAETPRVVE
ncbi:hypothetical protein BJX63DRAFT_431950 [Aspergillus granulosus]|uniref:Uncharacterized protein n=1 Tax=Aspergillus granulosus TaxID=176169 RepID=A0ABR4HDX0_9EURO